MPLLRRNERISLFILITAMVIVVVSGSLFTRWRCKEVDRRIREDILIQTVEIAQTINPVLVKKLTFTGSDYKLPEYQQIRSQMIAYGKLIRQRGIYSMALKGSDIVFGPENYPEGDPMGAGPPGTIYEQPEEADFKIFNDGKPVVTGPVTDEYGTFISGMAPVFDPSTGKVLIVIGIDIMAEELQSAIAKARIQPIAGMIILLLLLGTGFYLIRYRNRLPDESKMKFRHIETYLTAIVGGLVTLVALFTVKGSETRENNYLFRIKSNSEIDAVRKEFIKVNQELLTLETFFINSRTVEPDEFFNFTTSSGFNKIAAKFFWVPRVGRYQKALFEKNNLRFTRNPGTLLEYHPGGTIGPAGIRDIYYPVCFADSSGIPVLAPGFDLASIPGVSAAMEYALNSKMTTGVEHDENYRTVFDNSTILALDPVFKTLNTSIPESDRAAKIDSSFIGALVNVSVIIQNAMKSNSVLGPQLDIDLVDLTHKPNPVRISEPLTPENRNKEFDLEDYKRNGFHYIAPLFMFGKSYALITYSETLNQKANTVPNSWMIFLIGILFTGITTFFIRSIQNKHITLARIVKQRTSDLETAMEKALESDRLKSSFLANMSHEIRTPMNAIVGFSSLLGEPDIPEQEREKYIEIIKTRSDDLLHLVNDILEMSRLESGTVQLVKSQVDLDEMMDELSVIFNQKLLKNHKTEVRLIIEKTDHNYTRIISDGYVIRQIFSNLLENAIKFTHKGEIWFGYRTDEHSVVTGFVRDSGIGISPENQKVIFDSFRQAEIRDIHQYGGTGLGLSICKGSVALLGGTIRVDSAPGSGSQFIFTFPAEAVPVIKQPESIPLSVQPEEVRYTWPGKKILVVEDEPSNLDYLVTILSHAGAELATAVTGKEVRDLYPVMDTIDLILLDIRLPDVSGTDLCHEIKSKFPSVIIIAQTAFAHPGDQEKGNEKGFDDYVTKPLDRRALLRKIDTFLKKKG
ncbi:MAG: response regulator [Alphaproteobacteria bacterium]|nr:response regulator [Alphaproteobacteria bacterium]